MDNKHHSFWVSGFLVTLLESRRSFFSLLLFFLFTDCYCFHFASSELMLLFFSFGDLTEHHRLAAVNIVSTVWCIRLLSALAQTCGPFLHCLVIVSFYKTKLKKKKILYTFKSLKVGTENPPYDTWHEHFCLHL